MATMDSAPATGAAEQDWPAHFFAEVDTFEIDRLAAQFAEDIEVRFGNGAPIHGKAAAVAAMADFWGTLRGIRHQRETLVQNGDAASQQSIVTYTRQDGVAVSMPVASYLRRVPDGRLDRLWIYIDMAPLFAAAA